MLKPVIEELDGPGDPALFIYFFTNLDILKQFTGFIWMCSSKSGDISLERSVARICTEELDRPGDPAFFFYKYRSILKPFT